MNITSKQLRALKAGKSVTKYAKEGDLVKHCLKRLEQLGAFAWKQNQGGMKMTGEGPRRFIRFAHVDGISDIIGVYKGRFLAVECKQPGRKPTDKQAMFLDLVKCNGGIAIVTSSVDEMELAIIGCELGDE